eukprot:CAMPEP_0178483550 /NCGR_PEP_ID=MMETSP0696-20121128/7294_1 /TAXON_ID=265572 /ORGANISM="Extubocellulus spinifer, Strain CCMP396" /LENGTH=432 /DNA_ID=CAMNT_0020111075 /DNA_START=42 /DNA_END=1341 /DNA_ORIENTATION=-
MSSSGQASSSCGDDDDSSLNTRKQSGFTKSDLYALQTPPGMNAVRVGVPFQETTQLTEISNLDVSKVFVLSNKSSRPFLEGEGKFIDALKARGLLAAPLNCDVGMGGGEDGLLKACDEAYAANADCIVTVGGGAIQDAGKLVRLWLSTRGASDDGSTSSTISKATVKGIQAAQKQDPMPSLPPQIACPNSFAMAELTHVAGITTNENVKSGAAHPSMMPTVVIYDPALSKGMPDWVRFGTALRGVEHAVGAVCHPKADEDIRERAISGLRLLNRGLKAMVDDPESEEAQSDCYHGGWMAIRALNTGCYPSLGHLIENHYSARFNVHQGSCSGILCARILNHHGDASLEHQKRISDALGDSGVPAPRMVSGLVSSLPGVSKEHAEEGVTPYMLREFADYEYNHHIDRVSQLSPKPFGSAEEIFDMLTFPLGEL